MSTSYIFVDSIGKNGGWTTDFFKIHSNFRAIDLDVADIIENCIVDAEFLRIFGAGRYIIIFQFHPDLRWHRMDVVDYQISIEDYADELLDNTSPTIMHELADWQKAISDESEEYRNSYQLSDNFLFQP